MRKRLIYGSGVLLLVMGVALMVWQGSFDFGNFAPANPEQTYTVWAISTLIFLLTVTIAFMLIRNFAKLYVDRRRSREGSRIRTKLVLGALALTFTPVLFLVIFSVQILNRNLDKWFSRPAQNIQLNLAEISEAIEREARLKARAELDWVGTLPEIALARAGANAKGVLQARCAERGIEEIRLHRVDTPDVLLCAPPQNRGATTRRTVDIHSDDLTLRSILPIDMARTQMQIQEGIAQYQQLHQDRKTIRRSYLLLLMLITLFILFVTTWTALFLARQISVPITAVLDAAGQIRSGNLAHRVRVGATDELATLVRSFNEMAMGLDANSRELEKRRRFTEAILESIPTGVISLTSDGRFQRVNRALKGLFSADQVELATRLEDLFSPEDTAEIRYLMGRARRMGLAASQLEFRTPRKVMHLSATVAALDENVTSGFVLVLEDTSDLLRAQKAAAWHEVARRIAHEIRNPLTPIALCAERIVRQLDRPLTAETPGILRECSGIICSEVESLKSLVGEFSQFARFPAAQPAPSDLNEVVENALTVFAGRLDGIDLRRDLAPGLPQVNIDREQFKRVVANLIDNAAEAMKDSMVRRLYVGTISPAPELVELIIADTGSGISPEDKEKLFLPYFSTKDRGTGLGLAIVNHILSDHSAQIRVEDNIPSGARFIVELHGLPVAEPEPQSVGASI